MEIISYTASKMPFKRTETRFNVFGLKTDFTNLISPLKTIFITM